MQVSAKNQLSGKISRIVEGAINNEVTLTLDSGEKITTVITLSSCHTLKLEVGKPAVALIKAPWVIIALADCNLQFSARNQFQASVTSLTKGSINSSVHMKTDNGTELTAVITNESVANMNLTVGRRVIALIKASNVMIATPKL